MHHAELPVTRTIFRFIGLTFALLVIGTTVSATNVPSDDEIKTILRNFIERDHWGVGMVVGIVDEHGTRVISYGKLDNGDSTEVNADTLFEIGSITKTFTTLLQRGEMRLDDPVEKYLPPTVKVPSRDGRKISLLDLATHSSGLPRDGLKEWTFTGLYEFLSHCRLRRNPGVKAEYSNIGMCLLGHAIELKAGTNFEALVRQRICGPLDMDSTCIKPTPELRPRWAKSHGQENRVVWDMDAFYSGLGGSGALRSSVNDMLKYAAAEIGLTNSSLTPLMERTHVVRFPRAFETFGRADLAMPWWIYHWDGADLITHGGTTSGHKAFLGFDKKLKRGVVVLANRSDPLQQAVEPLGMYLLHPPASQPVPAKVTTNVLDSYEGLYVFPDAPEVVMSIRRDGDRLLTQLLNGVGGDWVALSDTVFFDPWFEARMTFTRKGRDGMAVLFSPKPGREMQTWRARRVSNHVPDSLFQPMLQPLSTNEFAPRKDSDLQGTWKGTIRPWYWPFVSRHGTLSIAERSPGNFSAELNLPAERVEKLPIAVIYHPPGIELVNKSGDGMFKGKINADHTKMMGRIIQGSHSIGVTLRRVGANE